MIDLSGGGGASIKLVTSYVGSMINGVTIADITIPEIDTDKASIRHAGTRPNRVAEARSCQGIIYTFLNSTTVRATRFNGTDQTFFAFDVIEFNRVKNKSSFVGTIPSASNNTSVTVASPRDTTLMIIRGQNWGVIAMGGDESEMTCFQNSDTSVVLQRRQAHTGFASTAFDLIEF